MIQKPQNRSFFKSPWLWTILALVLIVAFAAFVRPSASVESEVTVDEPTQMATQVVAENKTVSQPETSEPAANSTQITEEETEITLTADTPSSDNCIACHTDEEKLQELAEEPEEVHSEEASGEG